MNIYYTGDSFPIRATLTTNGTPVDLTNVDSISACIVGDDFKSVVIPPVSLTVEGIPTLGVVVGVFPSSVTKVPKVTRKTYLEIETKIGEIVTTYGHTEIIIKPSYPQLG